MAHSLAEQLSAKTGKAITGYFINIKGPELLNKYVGETERKIREIFQRAREKATEGMPVVIFFDEMDSLFRTRGSGVSSDMEATIVPQFLAELDGVEGLANVIVVGNLEADVGVFVATGRARSQIVGHDVEVRRTRREQLPGATVRVASP